jgi:putative hydrolase of HD superfamily
VGYLLAKAEGVDPYPVVLMCLFGDIQEARINDLHKLGQRYINFRKAEEAAFAEQVAGLPLFIRNELSYIRKEYVGQKTREGIIARDADILECLLQAKEYAELGFKVARRFLKQAPSHLKTVSARSLWRALRGHASQRWWERLSKFER